MLIINVIELLNYINWVTTFKLLSKFFYYLKNFPLIIHDINSKRNLVVNNIQNLNCGLNNSNLKVSRFLIVFNDILKYLQMIS